MTLFLFVFSEEQDSVQTWKTGGYTKDCSYVESGKEIQTQVRFI